MRNRELLFVLLSVVCWKGLIQAQQQTNHEKPNIIFILTDDQRYDAIGYAGNKYVHTPEMDELARSGSYFHNAIVTTPICAASRASILTGLYERAHNFNFQTGNVREEYMRQSYPRILKENGYFTGFYGKYGVKYQDLDKQFDEYESYDRNTRYDDRRGYFYKTISEDTVHLTRYTGQKAIDFIESAPEGQPFCLSLSFSAPHAHDSAVDQYYWQHTTDSLLADTKIPDPQLGDDQYFEEQPEIVREGFNRLRWTWRYDTPEKYQHSLKGYYRMISGIDLEIAKIRATLAENGLDKNTVIILMGDNGYFLGERQLAGKWLMYDNSIRVPLIVYDPREDQHQDISDMALNVDVPSTIVDLAGINPPATWQGISLMPIVRQDINSLGRDAILVEHLWEFSEIPPSEGVRTQDWKYFRYVNDKSIEELYNLKNDPQEINNLIGKNEYRTVAADLRSTCDKLITEKRNTYRNPPTNLTVDFLRNPDPLIQILNTSPEFGWNVPMESKFQSAYQVLVSSSLTNIHQNKGDLWDSGRVISATSIDVEYEGKPLASDNTYFWKVRIWDNENRLVDYSDAHQFIIVDR